MIEKSSDVQNDKSANFQFFRDVISLVDIPGKITTSVEIVNTLKILPLALK